MEKVLFKTIHGSHLYGLAHDGSDVDWYTVVSRETRGARKKYARQNITDGVDNFKVDLSTFRHFCDEGVPQALEALFSTVPEVDEIEDFRKSYTVGLPAVYRTYSRTIRNFVEADEFKRRRHAVRLAYNLATMTQYGRFNPTMSEWEIKIANNVAERYAGQELLDMIDAIMTDTLIN